MRVWGAILHYQPLDDNGRIGLRIQDFRQGAELQRNSMLVAHLLPDALLHSHVVRFVVDPFSRHGTRLLVECVHIDACSNQSLRDVLNHVLRRYTHQ